MSLICWVALLVEAPVEGIPYLDKQKIFAGKICTTVIVHPVMGSLWKVNRTGKNGAQPIPPAPPHEKQNTWHHPDQMLLNLPNMGHRDMQELTTIGLPAYEGKLSDEQIGMY